MPNRPTRSERLALLDWDNSLQPGFMLVRWGNFLKERGVGDRHTWECMSQTVADFLRGVIPYDLAAQRIPALYCQSLCGVDADTVKDLASTFVAIDEHSLFNFVVPFLDGLASRDVRVVVVSGAPGVVLEAYRSVLPITRYWGVEAGILCGRYTGQVEENGGHRRRKAEIAHLEALGGTIVVAIGDSEADLPLLESARSRIVVDSDTLISCNTATLTAVSATTHADELLHFVDRYI